MMKEDQFAYRKTRTSSSEDTGSPTQPDGCKRGPLAGCRLLTSQVMCLRESCTRETRTRSLGGGRRPARKRASSDPTKRCGSRNFIGLRTICEKALFGAGFLAMLTFVLHHLGDLREVEFANRQVWRTHFYPMFLGSPNGSCKSQPYRSPPQCISQVTAAFALQAA